MKTDNNEAINLSDRLSRPVNVTQAPVFAEQETDNEPVMDAVEEAVYEETPTETSGNPQADGRNHMPPQDIAETIVSLMDGLQSSLVPYLREQKVFSSKELEQLDTLDRSGGTAYPVNSPELKLLEKWNRHQAIVEKIPFNEGETRRLVNATAAYAKTTDMKVSPLQGLLLSYSEVILKRSAYFFTD